MKKSNNNNNNNRLWEKENNYLINDVGTTGYIFGKKASQISNSLQRAK